MTGVAQVLSGMFRQAEKNGIIKKNPVPLASLPRANIEKERRDLSKEEQKIFLEYCKKFPSGDLFEMALSTGMRSGELRGLQWKDVDFTNKTIHVVGTLVNMDSSYFIDMPKTRTSKRDIPMLDNVYEILKQRRKEQNECRLALGREWKPLPDLESLVFTMTNGRPMSQRTLSDRMDTVNWV